MPDTYQQAVIPSPDLVGGVPIYFTGEDAILLTVFNAAAGVTVKFSGRFLPVSDDPDPTPSVQLINESLIPATDRSASTRVVGCGEGWLLDWQVSASVGTPFAGQCFAKVEIQRGLGSSALIVSRLGRGYVTAKQGPEGPFGIPYDSIDSQGAVRSITGTTPGAGAEISEVVPTGARWKLIAFEADLVTSAAAANRVPQLTIDDGANVFARVSVNQNETAGQTWRNSFQLGVPQTFDGTRFVVTTPLGCDIVLAAGYRVRTVTASIQAGDQYSAPQYLVQEVIEGA